METNTVSTELVRLAACHGATFKLSREATGALVSALEQRLLAQASPLSACTDLRELLRSDNEEDEQQKKEEQLELPSNALELAFLARCYPALVVCTPDIYSYIANTVRILVSAFNILTIEP